MQQQSLSDKMRGALGLKLTLSCSFDLYNMSTGGDEL